MGLYYLQSRYYDPELCRFLNADAFVSTGQGELGNNMFAYCGNNPACYSDETGRSANQATGRLGNNPEYICLQDGCGGAAGALIVVGIVAAGASIGAALSAASIDTWYQVKQIAKSYVNARLSIYDDSQPRVHHIVPVGTFSGYSIDAQNKLRHMQKILRDVGIDVANSSHNLVVLSQGYHKTIHTEWYIHFIYDFIMPAEGNRAFIIGMLNAVKGILLLGDPQTYDGWR